jgi:hypothetical protein
MSISLRFVAAPSEPSEVMAWFRSVSPVPTEVPTDYGYVLHFQSLGPLAYLPDGSIDPASSPIVTIVLPQVRRGVLWTIGEVHFRPTPLRKQFPILYKVKSAFSAWLSSLERVFARSARGLVLLLPRRVCPEPRRSRLRIRLRAPSAKVGAVLRRPSRQSTQTQQALQNTSASRH